MLCPDDEQYLTENNIHMIFADLQEALLREKPLSPREFIQKEIERRRRMVAPLECPPYYPGHIPSKL